MLIISLQQDLLETSVGSISHVTATGDVDELEKLLRQYENDDTIEKIQITGSVNTIDGDGQRMLINGVTFDQNEITDINNRIIEGTVPAEDEVLLGVEYQSQYEIGDDIEVVSQTEINEYNVSGFFDLGSKTLNNNLGYVQIETLSNNYSEEQIDYKLVSQLSDVYESNAVSNEWQRDTLTVEEWQENNKDLLTGLNAQGISSTMIQVFIILSLVLTIMSVLIVSAIQKSKQIGILKAIGLNDKKSAQIYLVQGLILGTLGASFGIIIGLSLLWTFDTFVTTADGAPVVEIVYNLQFIIASFAIVTFASVLASIIPARKIRKLTAREVIVGE